MGLKDDFGRRVEMLSQALGHADRKEPFAGYCTGLMLSGERKSIEPMVARVFRFALRRHAGWRRHPDDKPTHDIKEEVAAFRQKQRPARFRGK